jgi:hypothetical protein
MKAKCAICGKVVDYVHFHDYEPITDPKTGKRYFLRQYIIGEAHQNETAPNSHDSQISEKIWID